MQLWLRQYHVTSDKFASATMKKVIYTSWTTSQQEKFTDSNTFDVHIVENIWLGSTISGSCQISSVKQYSGGLRSCPLCWTAGESGSRTSRSIWERRYQESTFIWEDQYHDRMQYSEASWGVRKTYTAVHRKTHIDSPGQLTWSREN